MRSLQDHFLIAMPAMGDPNFNTPSPTCASTMRTGALGVVINRPSDTSLGELLGQLDIAPLDQAQAARAVLRGGPVERERGFVLHRSTRPFDVTLRRGRRDPRDRIERHFGRGRTRRRSRSPMSSRSATPAGDGASSRRSCSRTRGSRCRRTRRSFSRHRSSSAGRRRSAARRRRAPDHELCRSRLPPARTPA